MRVQDLRLRIQGILLLLLLLNNNKRVWDTRLVRVGGRTIDDDGEDEGGEAPDEALPGGDVVVRERVPHVVQVEPGGLGVGI